mgnify:CR=1 FL=1
MRQRESRRPANTGAMHNREEETEPAQARVRCPAISCPKAGPGPSLDSPKRIPKAGAPRR